MTNMLAHISRNLLGWVRRQMRKKGPRSAWGGGGGEPIGITILGARKENLVNSTAVFRSFLMEHKILLNTRNTRSPDLACFTCNFYFSLKAQN